MYLSVEASTLTLGAIFVTALVVPHLVAASRKRFSRARLPVPAYGPHLMFLCVVRFVPMFKDGNPPPISSWVAFGQVVALWAGAVTISEWLRNRQPKVRARDV